MSGRIRSVLLVAAMLVFAEGPAHAQAAAYGDSTEPEETSGTGTSLEANGISLQASEDIYARLKVTPGLVMASIAEKPGVVVDLLIDGLPEGEDHYIYLGGHDDFVIATGTTATLSLDLSEPRLL